MFPGRVVLRGDLDDVASDEVEAVAAPDDLDPLWPGEAGDLGSSGAGRDGGVETVDVECHVDGTFGELHSYLVHHGDERAVPALLDRYDPRPESGDPIEVVGGVAGAAQSDLHSSLRVDESVIDRVAEPRTMRDRFTEHRSIHVGVGVDVHESDGSAAFRDRAQDRVGDRVVATDRQRDRHVVEKSSVVVGDDVDADRQVERVERDVARVTDAQAVERRRASGHVVRAQQAGFGAHCPRAEPCPGTVGGADVEGHADESDVNGEVHRRQPHHRRRPAESRHLVAAERLRERRLRHRSMIRHGRHGASGPLTTAGW